MPFVGTVPAIKPACTASVSRQVSVLGTEATVNREYTRALIREFGQGCQVALIGPARLATSAEADLSGEPMDDSAIAAEIAPCFVSAGDSRTDTVVLACTHYPLLLERLQGAGALAGDLMDPAPAIARRVTDLLGGPSAGEAAASGRSDFHSDRAPPPALAAALSCLGTGRIASV